jgi:NAD-dependent SIR2 family protein deacetylase
MTADAKDLLPQVRALIEQWRQRASSPDVGSFAHEAVLGTLDNCADALSLLIADHGEATQYFCPVCVDTVKVTLPDIGEGLTRCAECGGQVMKLQKTDHGEATTDATAHEQEKERLREGTDRADSPRSGIARHPSESQA